MSSTKIQQEQHEEELDLHAITEFERLQFAFVGLYPLLRGGLLDKVIHYIRLTILIILSTLLVFSMTIALVIGVDNLSELSGILYYLITQSAYVIKLFNWMVHRWKLPLLEDHFDEVIPLKYYKIYGRKNLDDIVDVCTLTARIFRLCVTGVLVFFILVPLISEDILLPLAGWMPVDKKQYRAPIFVIQISCYFVSAYTNSSIDIFTAYYISIGVGHLRLLKTCLTNVDYTREQNQSEDTLKMREVKRVSGYHENNRDKEDEQLLPGNSLEELVLMHKQFISYVGLLESTFSYGVFVQFLASVCVICLTGFQMLVTSPASVEFVLLMFYFFSMVCQVVLYCWYGNEILFESNGISEACYMSNWYDAPQAMKKSLFLMMERSKKNIVLTAGKFFVLSLPTLVMIAKSSYSYFAVLRRIYQDN